MTTFNPPATLIFAVTLACAIGGSYVTIASALTSESKAGSPPATNGHRCRQETSQTTQKACRPILKPVTGAPRPGQ
jgi:hypothetical protein